MTTVRPRKNATPPARTKNRGWTKHAALRNRQFLYDVVPQQLSGMGFSITLTVKHCPDPDTWAVWRKRYVDYIRKRFDLTRYHLVTEWQRRGAPHLHLAMWFGVETAAGFVSSGSASRLDPEQNLQWTRAVPNSHQLVNLWLQIAATGEPSRLAQDVKQIPVGDAAHWLRYLAKHGVRGVSNYQRSPENIPKAWQGETGRIWQKGGDWPLLPPMNVEGLETVDLYQIRRLYRNYLASVPPSMRVKPANRASVRRFWSGYLKANRRDKARYRAVSAFIDIEVQARIILSVQPEAFFVNSDTGEIYHSVEEMPLNRTPQWVEPLAPQTDISELLRAG